MARKRYLKPIFLFVLIFLLMVVGYLLYNYSRNINKEIAVNYNEKSNIDYKVYLKENSFFETPYLEKNRTYIASLIDYILIDFDYAFDVDASIKGNYSYYIKGTISANKSNSKDNYWSKDYILSEKTTKYYSNTKKVNINSEAKVNYQLYNNLLNDFKSQYGVTMDGVLTVSLIIENDIENDLIDREIEKTSSVELNIPLTTLTVEVPIKTSELNNHGSLLNKTVQENVLFYTVIKYLGYSCFVISFLVFIKLIHIIIFKSKFEDKYDKTLSKILKTYDNIIVNAKNLPDMDGLKIVSVMSFNELIDAQGEVRQPINYISLRSGAVFILINDGMGWKFELKKDDFKKRKIEK